MSTIKSSDEHLTLNADGSSKDIKLQSNASEKVIIKSTGNVGINNSAPTQRLEINGNSQLNAHDNPSGSGGYFTTKGMQIGNAFDAGLSGGDDDRNAIVWNERGTSLLLGTDNTERMRIDYNGKVGIGVTNPAVTLELAGGGGAIRLPSGGELQFGGSANKIYGHASNNYLRFDTNSTERMRVTDNGLTFNGDTAAANALDDYEEGIHTVTANASGGGTITLSSTNNKFTYTKIGNLVTVTGRLDVSSVSNPTGDLSFTLPHTIAQIGSTNNTDTSGAMFVWNAVSGDTGLWVSWADAGTSALYARQGSGAQAPQTANLVKAGTEFRLNFSYRTA